MQKRQALAAILCAAALPRLAHAADWPKAQPIRIVVPAAAGSSPDQTSRKLSTFLQGRIGQSFVIENRPGAAGTIAMQAVATAKADGYTLGFGNIVTMAINRSLIGSCRTTRTRTWSPSRCCRRSPMCWWCARRCRSTPCAT